MQTSNPPTYTRFAFRGNAIPIGGRILQVKGDYTPYNLQSPPASALSVAGGHCDASSPGGVFRDIFSWGQTVAQSQGDEKQDGSHVATVTSSIMNVRAANGPHNVFTVDQLRLTLVSTHPKQGQPSVVPTQVMFHGDKGMFLNQRPITLTTDLDDFCRMSTLEQFDSEFKTNKAVWQKYRDRFFTGGAPLPEFHQPIPRVINGYVVCSLVNSVKWGNDITRGNALKVDGFGTIHFGEILMNEYSRRYTLVRLAMGSDVKAEVALGEGDSNGGWVP
jgi:hypothetical protein